VEDQRKEKPFDLVEDLRPKTRLRPLVLPEGDALKEGFTFIERSGLTSKSLR
jgi:hypothetical protein